MDRKGVVIILIALGLALGYNFFISAPKANEARKKYAELLKQNQDAKDKAEAEAKAAAEAKAKTMPVNITVRAQLPNANVEAVKINLAAPIEQQVATLENYVSTSPTISADGTLKLTVSFKPGTDPTKARDQVQTALDQAKTKLPAEAKIAGVEVETAAPSATPAVPEKPTEPVKPTEPAKTVTMTNQSGTVEYVFTEDGGGISTVTLKEHFVDKTKGTNVKLNEFGDLPIGALSQPNAASDPSQAGPKLDLAKARWKMLPPDTAARTVSFEIIDPWVFPGVSWNIKITKKFTLAPTYAERREQLRGEYLVKLDVTYENLGPVAADPVYYVHIGGSSPTTLNDQSTEQTFDWWHNGSKQNKPVDWYSGGGLIFKDPAHSTYQESPGLVRWVGVTSQYFTTILTINGGDQASEDEQAKVLGLAAWSNRREIASEEWSGAGHGPTNGKHLYHLNAAMELPKTVLAKQGDATSSKTVSFQLFAGPREYRRLRLLDHSEADILNYTSFLFIPTGAFSKLLLNSMNGLFNLVGHYALSIVLLTIILKAILWPLQSKANRSMKKMATLSPMMKELQAKYKDEPQKYQQEMGKLFKKAGVNPLSGCWPILIQIPIFVGFYGMLGKAVELRHQGFWWVSDLSAPDTVGHIMGLPINPLPLLMAVTMILQMKLAPQGGDPAQRKMMMIMPVIFIVMCYNFASGLALYWTVQNLISIFQLFVNRAKEASQKKVQVVR